MFNLLIGGAAGQGIETTGNMIEKLLKANGFNVFVTRDLMSRVRGGHNFTTLRFGREPVMSHDETVDGIIAVNEETVAQHLGKLREDGFCIVDESYEGDDPRLIKLPMVATGKELKNPRVSSSVAVGTLVKMLGLPAEAVEEIFHETLKEKYVDINIKAARVGFEAADETKGEHARAVANSTGSGVGVAIHEDDYRDYSDWMILNGNQAIGMGALAAGLNFYSAYPMSPSTSIMEYLAQVQNEANIVVEQAEDELAGINMAVGASYAGAVAMTGTSGGGYALKVEGMAQAGMMEVPVVTAIAMRPGPVTGLPTRTEQGDLELAIFAGNGEYPKAVIAVRHHSDAFYQAARAHAIAQKYQMPVVLLIDQYLADGSATVEPFDLDRVERVKTSADPEEALSYRKDYERGDTLQGETPEHDLATGEYKRYRLTEDGISPRLLPGNPDALVSADTDEHDEYGFITEAADVRIAQMNKRMRKLDRFREEDLAEPEVMGDETSDVLLVAWGSIYGPIQEAAELLEEAGTPVRVLVFGDMWPLPTKRLTEAAEQARHIINVEQNFSGQLGHLIRRETGITMTDSVLKYDGRQLTAVEIRDAVLEKLGK